MQSIQRVGRYRLVRVIGSGAFATVWLGDDPALEVPVAVKVLADNWVNNADVVERFLAEARLLRRINDPRVVRVFDVGVSEDPGREQARPYFVMEHVPGGTLADRIGTLSPSEALGFGVATAEAVQVLHDAGVVHRDLKPSNLLLDDRTSPPRLIVSDLGSAKLLAEASGITVTTGTPSYMAPEQIHQSAGFDARADVYAVAAVTYHLLTGEPPFSHRTAAAVVHRAPESRPAPVAAQVGRPAGLDHLLARALSWDPAARPSSAAEFARELSRFIPEGAGSPEPEAAGRELSGAAVVVGCVLLGALCFLFTYLALA